MSTAAAAAATGRQSRSASAVCAKAAKGFHVFRIDGYSLTAEALPGGERVSSKDFAVGGHRWRVDLYPNSADGSTKDDAASISLFVRRRPGNGRRSRRRRVRAQYQFSLLDAAGRAAYARPAATGVFTSRSGDRDEEDVGCGHAEFISKAALERRRGSLLKDDRLVVRCDVTVTELNTVHIGVKHSRNGSCADSDSSDDSSDSSVANRHKNSSSDSKGANSYNDSSDNSIFNGGGGSDSSDSGSDSGHSSDSNNSNCDSSSDDSDSSVSSGSSNSSSSDSHGSYYSSGSDDVSSDSRDSDGEMPAHRNKRRRLDDTEYVQQCLAERPS